MCPQNLASAGCGDKVGQYFKHGLTRELGGQETFAGMGAWISFSVSEGGVPSLLRKVLCWVFGITASFQVLLLARGMRTILRYHMLLTPHYLLITVLFQVVVAAVTGVSWWVILKEKRSANAWGTTASIIFFTIFLRPIIFSLPTLWSHHVGALIIGIIGLVTFLQRNEQTGAGP
jgi:hypothetical protein